ncbi:hypothetical protein P3T76_007524 [Phytophthora citrophthora]|uniref:Uncharacterized protein n=1 Tax=Phytophthora citrophthora TaxID=4793 RepID=A0AAD9GMF2_9STRA|nr:hypothetical protein P3T76_007524 [Phytophthora citrophthora]
MLPSGIIINIGEKAGNSELKLYQECGEMIQNNCKDYCKGILDKVEALYEHDNYSPIPFLCVEGSSGIGKTQVAFALAGNRPWFYWPVASIGSTSNSPLLNDNFASLSSAFDKVTRMDDPMSKADYNILGTCSNVYRNELWAYGFIRALLQYCCSVDTRTGVMLRFEEELPPENGPKFTGSDESRREALAILRVG